MATNLTDALIRHFQDHPEHAVDLLEAAERARDSIAAMYPRPTSAVMGGAWHALDRAIKQVEGEAKKT